MNTFFKRMTKTVAWVSTVSLVVGFVLFPTGAAAIEFFSTPFRYQWQSQSGTVEGGAHVVYGNAGDTVAMSLTVTNRSVDPAARVIYGKSALAPEASPYQGAHELRLGTANPHDNMPSWLDPSSFIANPDGADNRLAVYDGGPVNPGESLTLNWNIKISSTAANGTYDLYTGLVREFDAWAQQVNGAGTLLGSEDIFWRFVIGGGTVPTAPTGGLSVALAPGTPPAATIADNGNANFTKITLIAAPGATVNVTEVWVTRDGLSTDSQVENVKLLGADGVQIGSTAGGFNANHKAQIFINPALTVTGSMDFFIRAGIPNGADNGVSARLGIATNTDILSNATSVTGAPVYGNTMTVVQVAIGSITLAKDGTITDSTPDVGDTRVLTNTFKLTAGSVEAMTIERITVLKQGTAETSDTANIELWDATHAVTLGTVTSWTSDGKASWPVNLSLGKGETIRLAVYLDIKDGASLTVNTDASDGSDALVIVKGQTYGFYITPTYDSSTWDGKGDADQTINSGALVVSKSSATPATGNIAVADDQLLAVWDFYVTGEDNRISALTVRGDLTDDAVVLALTFADMTNARIVDMATGDILAGPVDGTDCAGVVNTTAVDPIFVFTNTFVLSPGTTQVGFKVKLSTDWAADDTITVQLYQATDLTVKGVLTNNTIDPTGFPSAANEMTVKAGAMVVRTLGNPPTGNVIVGTTDFTWGSFSFDASASGEDVLVSAVIITDTLDGTTADMANIDNVEVWADLDSNGTYEAKLDGPDNPTGGGGVSDTHTFTFGETVRVPKGEAINWIITGDLASGSVALGTHTLTVVADGETSIGAETGSAITGTASGSGGTLEVTAAGSLGMAVDGSSPAASVLIAGTTGNTVAKFKLTAIDEAVSVTKLTLMLDTSDSLTQFDAISKLTIEYPTETGTSSRSITPSAVTVVFDNLDMYVPQNDSAVVTVKVDLHKIKNGPAAFGDRIFIGFDYGDSGTEFAAVGVASGTAITAAGSADADAKTHYLYETLVTVTKDTSGLSSTLVPGTENTLYKWKMTADSAGPVGLKRLTFSVSVTDNTNSHNGVNVGGFTITKDSVDITSSDVLIAGLGGLTGSVSNDAADARASMETKGSNDVGGTGAGDGSLGTTTTYVHVMFGDHATAANQPETGEMSLPAGSTTTWTFNGTAGANFVGAEDDSIAVKLEGDTTSQTARSFDIVDDDVTDDEYSIVLATTAGVTDTADVEFIWSDFSAISHTGAMADNTGTPDTTPDSSSDWTNGYLIKNFPLGSWSLIT